MKFLVLCTVLAVSVAKPKPDIGLQLQQQQQQQQQQQLQSSYQVPTGTVGNLGGANQQQLQFRGAFPTFQQTPVLEPSAFNGGFGLRGGVVSSTPNPIENSATLNAANNGQLSFVSSTPSSIQGGGAGGNGFVSSTPSSFGLGQFNFDSSALNGLGGGVNFNAAGLQGFNAAGLQGLSGGVSEASIQAFNEAALKQAGLQGVSDESLQEISKLNGAALQALHTEQASQGAGLQLNQGGALQGAGLQLNQGVNQGALQAAGLQLNQGALQGAGLQLNQGVNQGALQAAGLQLNQGVNQGAGLQLNQGALQGAGLQFNQNAFQGAAQGGLQVNQANQAALQAALQGAALQGAGFQGANLNRFNAIAGGQTSEEEDDSEDEEGEVQTDEEGAEVRKHLYYYSAPEEPEEPAPRITVPQSPAKKNIKILFIKTPSFRQRTPVVYQAPRSEEKTRVYVLVQKPDQQKPIEIPAAAPTIPTKPEVFFIKYKTQQEAEQAISQVQSGQSIAPGTAPANNVGDTQEFVNSIAQGIQNQDQVNIITPDGQTDQRNAFTLDANSRLANSLVGGGGGGNAGFVTAGPTLAPTLFTAAPTQGQVTAGFQEQVQYVQEQQVEENVDQGQGEEVNGVSPVPIVSSTPTVVEITSHSTTPSSIDLLNFTNQNNENTSSQENYGTTSGDEDEEEE